MKIQNRRFVIALVTGVVAVLVIGGGVYVYVNNKEAGMDQGVTPIVTTNKFLNEVESEQAIVNAKPLHISSQTASSSLVVLSANKSETVKPGGEILVKWKSTNNPNNKVYIGLAPKEKDTVVEQITSYTTGVPDTGIYAWTVDSSIPPGEYRIVVQTEKKLENVYDISDNSVTIVSPTAVKKYENSTYGFSTEYPQAVVEVRETEIDNGKEIAFIFPPDQQNMSFNILILTKDWNGGVSSGSTSCYNMAVSEGYESLVSNGINFSKFDVSKTAGGKANYTSATEYCTVRNGVAYRLIPRITNNYEATVDVNTNETLNRMFASFRFI